VLEILQANSIFDVLAPQYVARIELPLCGGVQIQCDGIDLGLAIETFAAPGKVPLYLERTGERNFGTEAGDTLGLRIIEAASGKSFFYVPACARLDASLADRLRGAALVLFDGTLWSENEMIEQGLMSKTGSRMGHINMSGPEGSIAAFANLGVARRIFVHINNSNPVLNAKSREFAAAQAAGWEIGWDGMELTL